MGLTILTGDQYLPPPSSTPPIGRSRWSISGIRWINLGRKKFGQIRYAQLQMPTWVIFLVPYEDAYHMRMETFCDLFGILFCSYTDTILHLKVLSSKDTSVVHVLKAITNSISTNLQASSSIFWWCFCWSFWWTTFWSSWSYCWKEGRCGGC